MDNKIIFTTEDNEEVEFFVVEQTRINGINYILVADSSEDEANALILKEVDGSTEETVYSIVEDEEELMAISKVFEELVDDVDIEVEP